MATVTPTEANPGPEATPAPTPSQTFPPHRLTVGRYRRMVEAGVFSEDEPVFLWRGRLVEKMTKGDPHAFAVVSLNELLVRLIPAAWHVRPEQPIAIVDSGLPEPDLTVVRGRPVDYKGKTPSAGDVALIVEVSASSLAVDSGDVLASYAGEGIPVYWIVDILGRKVEVYGGPIGPADSPRYRECRRYAPGERVPVVLDGREVGAVAVDDFLP